MNVTSLLAIALGAILTNNFILVKFLGICPFMGVSKKTDTALGMGVAVTFVMALASMVTWAVDHYILTPLDLGYMQTAAFILIIAAIVQVVEMFLKKSVPTLYQALGIYLPLMKHADGLAFLVREVGFQLFTSVFRQSDHSYSSLGRIRGTSCPSGNGTGARGHPTLSAGNGS